MTFIMIKASMASLRKGNPILIRNKWSLGDKIEGCENKEIKAYKLAYL